MSDTKEGKDAAPACWGDWRPCKLCNVVLPPRCLGEDGCCSDTEWCIRNRHAPSVPQNGNHAHADTNVMTVTPEFAAKKQDKVKRLPTLCDCDKTICDDEQCKCEKPKRRRKKKKSTK